LAIESYLILSLNPLQCKVGIIRFSPRQACFKSRQQPSSIEATKYRKPRILQGQLDVLMTPIQRLGYARSKILLKALPIVLGSPNTTARRRIWCLSTEALQEFGSSSPSAAAAGLPFTSYPLPEALPPPPPPPPPPQKIETSQTGLQRRMDGSFYMRELPSSASLIPYDSPEGKKVFKQALDEGGLEAFFPLSQQFLTQEEPACTFPSPLHTQHQIWLLTKVCGA